MAETDKDDLISIIEEDDDENLPTTLPLMPVRDVVIFSDMLLPLFIGREKSVRAVEHAVSKDSYIFLVTQKDQDIENPAPQDIYKVGTVGKILRMLKLPDGRVKTLVQGVAKARIKKYTRKRPFFRVNIEIVEETGIGEVSVEMEALMRNVRENSERILSFPGRVYR